MSFFDDTKNFGTMMLAVGLIAALISLIGIISELFSSDISVGDIVIAIGSLIYGVMIAGVGARVRNGEISQKIQILGWFVAVIGAGFIVVGLFDMAGLIIDNADNTASAIGGFIISLILGLITVWIAKKMMDGKTTTIDRVIWLLLLVIFVLMILASIIGMFSVFGGLIGILTAVASFLYVIIYLSLLVYLLSDDVKRELGMA